MQQNMKAWCNEQIASERKKALPILSFPIIDQMGCSVKDIVSSSDLQCEAMKKIADLTDSAASVSFMDLSVEAECFGAKITFLDDEVPTVIGTLLETEEDVDDLTVPEIGAARSGLYIDTIKKVKEKITDRPIFAGMIGPYSLAARLMGVTEIMINGFEEPDMVHKLLDKVTDFLISYGLAYNQAGANGVVMAEPVAGLLDPDSAEEFSAPYVKKIVDAVQNDEFIVIYHNCGSNTIVALDSILSTCCAAYHFGNAIDMGEMMEKMPQDILTMGNIDPAGVLLNGTVETVKAETQKLMENCAKYPNFIPSSGCDIPPKTPWENIDAFFETVKNF